MAREISGTWMRVVVFFKMLPAKGLAQNGMKAKGGKKSKQKINVAFFVGAGGGKVVI